MNFFNKFNKLTKRKIDYKKIFVVIGIILICVILVVLNKNKSRAIFRFDGTGTTINSVVSGEVIKLKCDEMTEETSNANSPSVSLASNMIPVCYNSEEDVWLKADSSNSSIDYQWYSYSGKTWANAVTVTDANRDKYLRASVGTPIAMSDVNTMWVWIPRFSATTNIFDCSTINSPTYERYPQCYKNSELTLEEEQKLINMCIDYWGDDESNCIEMLNDEKGDEEILEYWISDYEDWSGESFERNKYFDSSIVVNNYNGETQFAPGAFNITFVDKETTAHDAFEFGGAVSGFWIGKFEISHSTLSSSTAGLNLGCTNETCKEATGIEILPNKVALRYNDVSNMFYATRSMEQSGNPYGFDKTVDTTLDPHMLKNNEWGAVAYLTQSIYGRCTSSTSCSEIGINNNSSYITGYGAPAGSSKSVTNGTYETSLGMDASTTGNIYGVYDMSGGTSEDVMGAYWDGTKLWSGNSSSTNSGFNGWLNYDETNYDSGVPYPSDSKYYNLYTTSSSYTSAGLQHALSETTEWYGDRAYFVYGDRPWVSRGGYFASGSAAGVFSFDNSNGSYYSNGGARPSATVN